MPTPTADLADLSVERGTNVPLYADVAVVVMSTNSDPRTIDAVQSIIDQDLPAEIVVVNTGTGSLKNALIGIRDKIILVETGERQFAGGTRNLGIRFTSAPIVAFLAADCLATGNWLRLRLDAHARYATVASALRPAPAANGHVSSVGWACYVLTHFGRMPETPPAEAIRFGLSYRRALFDRYGLFDEQVRVGEDTLLNDMLATVEQPAWWPEIVTLHRYPETIKEALADQFKRGQRYSRFIKKRHNYSNVYISIFLGIRPSMSIISRLLKNKNSIYSNEIKKNIFVAAAICPALPIGMLFPDRAER